MRAYLNTELTHLGPQSSLLSVGLVTETGDDREFYAEVTDPERRRDTGWFGQCAVLPQFGRVALASCTSVELGIRLSVFMADLASHLRVGEPLDLACGESQDWELVEQSIARSGATDWVAIRGHIRPVTVDELTSFSAGTLAAEAEADAFAPSPRPIGRHHALYDARALRNACEEAGVRRRTDTPARPVDAADRVTLGGSVEWSNS